MNTHTHVLLAVTMFGGTFAQQLNQLDRRATNLLANSTATGLTDQLADSVSSHAIKPVWIYALIFGALLPDLSLFVMFGYAQLTGVPNEQIWSEMYYSPYWQSLGAMTNSLPLYLMGALAGWWAWQRWQAFRLLSGLVLMISVAALVHVLCDLPLHHDDGHPHFWPFTNWIYSSPVSYWDTNHYASFWVPVECALGIGLVVLLYKRCRRWWTKATLYPAALSYFLFAIFLFGGSR